jgi:hypothetical protein
MNDPRELQHKKIEPLSMHEQQDLIVLGADPRVHTLFKIMEYEIIEARDEAMACDPAEKDKRAALMDTAHAMAKWYTQIRSRITRELNEHLGEIKRRANEELVKDQNAVEKIILGSHQ